MFKFIPFFVYISGLGSLLLCDVLVTAKLTESDISVWAELRSLIGISGVLCLLGLEQVFVRSPASSARLFKLLLIQVPVLSAILGVTIWWLGFLEYWYVAVLIVFCAGSSGALFQYYRSHHMQLASQLSQQLWKILSLIGLISLVVYDIDLDIDLMVIGAMLLSIVLVGGLVVKYYPDSLVLRDPDHISTLYSIGLRFAVTGLLLSLAIYGEQLLVIRLGGSESGALYFTHATYFIFPASVVSGYFSFVIGPWARDNHDRYVELLSSKYIIIIIGALIYSALISLVGWIGWQVVDPTLGAPDYLLQGLFFLICFFRTLYIWPGAYAGIFGRPRQHDVLISGQVSALILSLLLFYSFYTNDVMLLVYSVAIASIVNWALRVAAASIVTGLIAKSRRKYEK